MRATRTYCRRDNWPGLRQPGDTDQVDVTSFGNSPVRFTVEGPPAADDFLLQQGTWHELGQPDRIRVSVEAA